MFGLNHLSDLFDKWAADASSGATSVTGWTGPNYPSTTPKKSTPLPGIPGAGSTTVDPWKPAPEEAPPAPKVAEAPGLTYEQLMEKQSPFYDVLQKNRAEADKQHADLSRLLVKPMTQKEPASDEPTRTTRNLTTAEYEQLSPQARALVDYNTMLAKAATADKTMGDSAFGKTQAQGTAYGAARQKVLGAAATDDVFAPNTLALLEQIGYKQPKAMDGLLGLTAAGPEAAKLEDYTSLKQAATDEDLAKYFGKTPAAADDERGKFLTSIATDTGNLAKVLAKGNKIIGDFQSSADAARAPVLQQLGMKTAAPAAPSQQDNDFEAGFRAVVATATNPDPNRFQTMLSQLGPQLEQSGYNTGDFFSYVANRLRNIDQYGAPDGVRIDTKSLADRLGLKVKGS